MSEPRFRAWLAGVLALRRSATLKLRRARHKLREARVEARDATAYATGLADRCTVLQSRVDSLRDELDGQERTRTQMQSQIDLLEGEVEFLAAWRDKELQTLRTEAATQAVKRGVANLGDEPEI
jgi:predicted nuclease with TOPRIM domain